MAIKKYLKIYLKLLQFGVIMAVNYRVSFLIEVLVEVGYSIVFVAYYLVILNNVSTIAGWSQNEVLFLRGLNIVVSEIIIGAFFVFNLWQLPSKIKNGDVDITLTKPLNSMFMLTLGYPYVASFFSIIPGIIIMVYSFSKLNIVFNPIYALISFVALIFGLIISYSLCVIIASFSFKFVGTSSLPRLASNLTVEYKGIPHDAFSGVVRFLLMYVFPSAFIASIPASLLIRKMDFSFVLTGGVLMLILFTMAVKTWNRMIKNYSSASS